MKHTIKQFLAVLTLLVIQASATHAEVKNSLTIKSNRADTIFVALAWKHTAPENWTTDGWYMIEPYGTLRTDLHDLSLDNNTMFVYAKGVNIPGSNTEFKIDNKKHFTINQADNITPKAPKAKFKSVQVGRGNTMFFID